MKSALVRITLVLAFSALGAAGALAASSQNLLRQQRVQVYVGADNVGFTGYISEQGTYGGQGTDVYHFDPTDPSAAGFERCVTACTRPNTGPSEIGKTRAYVSTVRVVLEDLGGQSRSKLATIFVNPNSFFISENDVYAVGEIDALNINFGEFGVVGSGSDRTRLENIFSQYKLKNYKIDQKSTAYWDPADATFNRNERLRSNIDRLLSERAVDITPAGAVVVGTLDFNSTQLNPTGAPEGGVVVIKKDITFDNVSILGRGTIIVEGNLTITNNFGPPTAQQGPVGVVVRKIDPNDPSRLTVANVRVEDPARGLPDQIVVGVAFFIPNGAFDTGDSPPVGGTPLTVKGAIVANTFDLSGRTPNIGGHFDITLTYDGTLAERTPPGFNLLVLPKLRENP